MKRALVRCATLLSLSLACGFTAEAQVLVSSDRGVVVAHDGRVELPGTWNVAGVKNATRVVAGSRNVAVLDALHNELLLLELESGRGTRFVTAETPVDALFDGNELYVLCRDGRVVQRLDASGRLTPAQSVDADSAFLRASRGRLFVYSRATGAVQELGGRSLLMPRFASDFEVEGAAGYLVYPREGEIRTIDLTSMKPAGTIRVGAVPVDLAFAGGGTALTARVLAVADPSAKRVWLTESTQSTTESVARGFLRGFLGLGLFGSRSSEFPTGVDRVRTRGNLRVAYDSSTGTLYRFTKRKSSVVATDVPPDAFALTADGIVVWEHGRVRIIR
jgi:hypothetical protein